MIDLFVEGRFGDVIGCASTDENIKHHVNNSQIYANDIMCIDYCLKLSLPLAGNVD